MPAKRRSLPGCARGFQFDEEDVSLRVHLSSHGVLNGRRRLAREVTQTSAPNSGGSRRVVYPQVGDSSTRSVRPSFRLSRTLTATDQIHPIVVHTSAGNLLPIFCIRIPHSEPYPSPNNCDVPFPTYGCLSPPSVEQYVDLAWRRNTGGRHSASLPGSAAEAGAPATANRPRSAVYIQAPGRSG